MCQTRSCCVPVLFALALLLLASWAQAQPPRYTLLDLGPTAHPAGLDAQTLRAVGWQPTPPTNHNFAWAWTPTPSQLPTLPDASASYAAGTAGGTDVGSTSVEPTGAAFQAFRTDGGRLRLLPTPHPFPLFATATTISATGHIGGEVTDDPASAAQPLRWYGDQVFPLPTLSPYGTYVSHVNALGDFVGMATTPAQAPHCAYWLGGGPIADCHTLPTATASWGEAINTHRQIAGLVDLPEGRRGFIFLPFLGMQVLPPLPGDSASAAYSLNDAGRVVGVSTLIGMQGRGDRRDLAVLWDNGQPVALTSLLTQAPGWQVTQVTAINERDMLIGTAVQAGVAHGVLLVPEVSTPGPTIPPAPVPFQSAHPGDFNGDGIADQVGLDYAGTIWQCLGGTPQCTQVPGLLTSLSVGDFNGDGRTDLVGLNGNAIWLSTNMQTWRNVPGALTSLTTGDFDGDGKTDLVGLYYSTIWMTTFADQANPPWHWVAGWLVWLSAGDVDGDGKDDLIGLATADANPNLYGTVWVTTQATRQFPQWTPLPGAWQYPQASGTGTPELILAWYSGCWYQTPLGGTWAVWSCPG